MTTLHNTRWKPVIPCSITLKMNDLLTRFHCFTYEAAYPTQTSWCKHPWLLFFSEWLHFHHCHHLHQMLIAQKLSQGWRTKTWQWCKGSCEMIAWDEINSRVLLLGDQLYNWKLLSQATVASSSIRKAQCMRTWFSFLQVFFSFTVPPNEVCSFHRSLQASSEPNYFVVWMRLEDINQHIHWENMERLWHF